MKRILHILVSLGLLAAVPCLAQDVVAQTGSAPLFEPSDFEQLLTQVGPMNTRGLSYRVSNVLEKYYANSLGGIENWEQVQSMRFEGQLRLADGKRLSFFAYMKKPNLCKVVVSPAGSSRRLVMAYDGEEAWQSRPGPAGDVVDSMSTEEASNFIRDAWFGGHLLYPTYPGKQIEHLGVEKVGDETLVNLQVTLPERQSLIYSISLNGFYEYKRSHTNAVNGELEVIEQSEFKQISGVRVPFKSVLTSNGVFVHEMTLDEVTINKGVISWMFDRPDSD